MGNQSTELAIEPHESPRPAPKHRIYVGRLDCDCVVAATIDPDGVAEMARKRLPHRDRGRRLRQGGWVHMLSKKLNQGRTFVKSLPSTPTSAEWRCKLCSNLNMVTITMLGQTFTCGNCLMGIPTRDEITLVSFDVPRRMRG